MLYRLRQLHNQFLLYYQQLSGIEPRGGGGRNESR